LAIQAKEILNTRERLNQLYQHHTNQPIGTIEQVMDRDTFMDVTQALDFGIIDSVLYKREILEPEEEN
jgi:ATP-dependent Clp protease protease subunit